MFSAALKRRQQVERLEHEADPLAADLCELAVASVPSSTSPSHTRPDVSVSRPARQCISVLLPEPDGPMIGGEAAGGQPDA